MKRIFIITGANGFLGNNIVRKLTENAENEVRALVLPVDALKSLDGLHCRIFHGDVTKKETLTDIFDNTENAEVYVIHCAAIVYIKTKFIPQVYNVNVNGTKNVIDKVLEKNAKLVYVSSVHAITEKPNGGVMTEITRFEPDKVVGQYAKTKAETANYILDMVRRHGLRACIVHPSGMIGPYDFGSSHLTQLIIDVAGGKLKAGVNGGYDFVDVRDAADGIISACFNGADGECYILSNRYVKVRELLDTITQVRGIKQIKTILPMWFAKLTAPLSELYYSILKQPPLYTKYSLYTLGANANFSNAKARAQLKFKTRELKETVKDTAIWLDEQGRLSGSKPKHTKIKRKHRAKGW